MAAIAVAPKPVVARHGPTTGKITASRPTPGNSIFAGGPDWMDHGNFKMTIETKIIPTGIKFKGSHPEHLARIQKPGEMLMLEEIEVERG